MEPRFRQLPTLADMAAARRAVPKHEIASKVDRAIEKRAASRQDERKLRAWAKSVKVRDEWKDRYTGKPVKATA